MPAVLLARVPNDSLSYGKRLYTWAKRCIVISLTWPSTVSDEKLWSRLQWRHRIKSKRYTNNLRTTACLNHTFGIRTRASKPEYHIVVIWSHCCLLYIIRMVERWSFCVSKSVAPMRRVLKPSVQFLFSYFSICVWIIFYGSVLYTCEQVSAALTRTV